MLRKHRWLSFALLLTALYLAYILTGLILMSFGTVKEWVALPGTVIAHADHDTDNSKADTDGPHVFYVDSNIVVKSIMKKGTVYMPVSDSFRLGEKEDIPIQCSFSNHIEWGFSTRLKDQLINEATVYPEASSIIVISDIEGDFAAFRKLLIANKVMNSSYEWTFDNGHLVLLGDYFDRGLNVTECLWLIYHLEQRAEDAGGKVHFILGNHEIMNMQGDLRYVRSKYIDNAVIVKSNYKQWFTENTELGRWLQTKNVAERIGNYLFVHGGISKKIADMGLSLEQINNACRPWYFKDDSTFTVLASEQTKQLYHSKASPFWYRGYVSKDASEEELEDVLHAYGASAMIVGHTVVKKVQLMYDGRLIATDVKHAEGNSQALYLLNDTAYRIDTTGTQTPL